ncbi:MAG: DUF3105 domain-containing protein [Anaerolineae bacterium]|nr:DUF3105 domain-containing protein [Anaerolineae bacterium]
MAKASTSINKRAQRQQQAVSRNKQRRILWLGGLVVFSGLLIFFVLQGVQNYFIREAIGQFVPSLGREHITADQAHLPYNSDPPTSGPHAEAVKSGFYESPIPDENIVHNLEHGHVVISYDCDRLVDCDTVKANLRRLINQYNREQVVAVPRKNQVAPITLTAWQRLDLLDEYDEHRLTRFIEAWRGRAPENVP